MSTPSSRPRENPRPRTIAWIREAATLRAAGFTHARIAKTLGHLAIGTTRTHYVKSAGIMARAIEALPQPPAFANGNGTNHA